MRVAVVHEWLVTYAGSERVLDQILQCFPTADLFCVIDFLPEAERGFLAGRTVKTTFIQKLPFARKVADQFMILNRGRRAAFGPMSELTEELVEQHLVV